MKKKFPAYKLTGEKEGANVYLDLVLCDHSPVNCEVAMESCSGCDIFEKHAFVAATGRTLTACCAIGTGDLGRALITLAPYKVDGKPRKIKVAGEIASTSCRLQLLEEFRKYYALPSDTV